MLLRSAACLGLVDADVKQVLVVYLFTLHSSYDAIHGSMF